jgi:hypothetical protein
MVLAVSATAAKGSRCGATPRGSSPAGAHQIVVAPRIAIEATGQAAEIAASCARPANAESDASESGRPQSVAAVEGAAECADSVTIATLGLAYPVSTSPGARDAAVRSARRMRRALTPHRRGG